MTTLRTERQEPVKPELSYKSYGGDYHTISVHLNDVVGPNG